MIVLFAALLAFLTVIVALVVANDREN